MKAERSLRSGSKSQPQEVSDSLKHGTLFSYLKDTSPIEMKQRHGITRVYIA